MEGPGLEFSEAVIDNGKYGRHTIRLESGILAQQADGSAVVYLGGDTILLAATTAAETPRDTIDFFLLTVDVEGRMYTAGRILGSSFRRKGRPGEDAILTVRLIDRPLCPAFMEGLRNEVQVIVNIPSLNPVHYYDVVAINAASMATALARLPPSDPIGGVRIAPIDEIWMCFPTVERVTRSSFQMIVAECVLLGEGVVAVMVEAGSTESTWGNVHSGRIVPAEEVVGQGLEAVKLLIKTLYDAQSELKTKPPEETSGFPVLRNHEDDVCAVVEELITDRVSEVMRIPSKQNRDDTTHAIRQDVIEAFAEHFEGCGNETATALKLLIKKIVYHRTLTESVRVDGWDTYDTHTLSVEVAAIPRVHNSALSQHGETQILGVFTLNMLDMEQKTDTLPPESTKRYMHNCSSPPFSIDEIGRVDSLKRREISHGALAERAIVPVLPTQEEFPYAIRQVSETIGSNGSTSMGSVCTSTLALLNTGMPLKALVTGIATGLMSKEIDGETRYVTLTDILRAEDVLGDMDLKAAGTHDFVTALQLDTELNGIPVVELQKALLQTRKARRTLLEVTGEAIDVPGEVSPYAPRIIALRIPVDKIGEVIGLKGEVINQIQNDTDTNITIEDDGTIYMGAETGETSRAAVSAINTTTNPHMPEKGERFVGTVVKITTFDAFISLLPGKDGLLHISKLRALADSKRVEDVGDVVFVEQKLQVGTSETDGRGELSLISVLEEEAEAGEA